jgi:hypothetical protein
MRLIKRWGAPPLDQRYVHLNNVSTKASSLERSCVYQLDGLCWVDRRDGMLEDDLDAISPGKHHSEIVEPPDLTLQPYAVDEKHSHIKFVVAEMFEECVLDRRGRLGSHV